MGPPFERQIYLGRRNIRLIGIYLRVTEIVDAFFQRHVHRIVPPDVGADFVHVSGAREEPVTVLVERNGHDAVGQIERLLDSVTVVHVDVDVQHARVVLEQLQYGDDDVVDVAEAGRLELLGVVQPAGPVDGDVAAVLVQLHRAVQRRARVHGTEVVQALEHRAVLAHVEVVQVLAVRGQVLRRDALQELDVLVVVEPAHVVRAGPVRPVDLHLVAQPVVEHQAVDDRQPVRFHRVRRPVMEVPHVRIVEVEHSLVGRHAAAASSSAVSPRRHSVRERRNSNEKLTRTVGRRIGTRV